jgi:hypothetical protein
MIKKLDLLNLIHEENTALQHRKNLMSNSLYAYKILNCFITYFMSGPLTLQQNRFGGGVKIFSSIPQMG